MNEIRDDVSGTLRFLGYGEVKPAETGEWKPLEAVKDKYGTTSETKIISRKNVPTCRLVDADTGERVATARKSEPVRSRRNEA